jgi:dihydroorotate dehydrogenase (NAD+) catalytic subunit
VLSSVPTVRATNRIDLSVRVSALRFKNPTITASGTFGYGVEFAQFVDLDRLGGLVTKGISLEPVDGAPATRMCETPFGMLNAIGLQNVGVKAFVSDKLPLLRKYNTHLTVNVFGYCLMSMWKPFAVWRTPRGLPLMNSIFPVRM